VWDEVQYFSRQDHKLKPPEIDFHYVQVKRYGLKIVQVPPQIVVHHRPLSHVEVLQSGFQARCFPGSNRGQRFLKDVLWLKDVGGFLSMEVLMTNGGYY
jgi:hypothetical protein